MKELHIVNIKKLEDKKFSFDDAGAIVVMGANGTGKSTVIQCIQNVLLAKNFIPNPVTTGKDEGSIEYTGKDQKGNTIVVNMVIAKDSSSTITAMYFDQEEKRNRKVSDPKTIRNLLGNYFPLGVHDVFSMLKYAEGRREFFQKYLTRILSEESIKHIEAIDLAISEKENKQTQGNLFFQRREIGKMLADKRAAFDQVSKSVEVPKYNREQLKEARVLVDAKITELNDKKSLHEDLTTMVLDFQNFRDDAELFERRMKEYFIKHDIHLDTVPVIAWADSYADMLSKKLPDLSDWDAELDKFVGKKDNIIRMETAWDWIDKSAKETTNLLEEIEQLKIQEANLTETIEKYRKDRIKIIKESKLPKGMSIDEEYNVYVDGILFHDASLSETMARMYIIRLLLEISGGGFIDIGDWSLYDLKSKEALIKLAKEKDCLMMGQYVNNEEAVSVKTIG